jgi:hypothetical protein
MLHQLSICHIRIVPLKSDMLINQRLFHSKKKEKKEKENQRLCRISYQLPAHVMLIVILRLLPGFHY